MVFKKVLISLLATFCFNSSAFAWDFEADEDPMDDVKTAVISQVQDGALLGFKCWNGKPEGTLFAITTSENWDQAASYPESFFVSVRVDKYEKFEIETVPENIGGFLAFAATNGLIDKVNLVLGQLKTAKERIAVQVGSTIYRFSVRNSRTVVGKMVERCSLELTP
jgi:hypothetical protein